MELQTPLSTAQQQLENGMKNRLRIEQAGLLRHTSIVRFVNMQLGEQKNTIRRGGKRQRPELSRSGVYEEGTPAYTASDGYVRRSPVQQLRTAPDYTKKLVKKAIGIIVLLLIAAGVVALLIKYMAF